MDAIDHALAPIRAGLEADGAGLVAEGIEDGGTRLVLRLVVSPEACADCLVGPEVMEQMVLAALQDQGSELVAVTVLNDVRTVRPSQ